MIRFKSIYKSEYTKIVDSYESEEELKDKYVFSSKVTKDFTRAHTTFSSRTRNKNERFKNELICKE